MLESEKIKRTVERNVKAVTLRPAIGQETEVMRVEVTDDGCCAITDGDKSLTIDLSEDYGGGGTTLSPGFYVRAALGACLAQGYHVWASYLGVPIERLAVELHAESDMRGNLGVDPDIPRSYLKIRYRVEIDSPAPRAAVEEAIEKSDDLDWVRDVFARAIPLERELRISAAEAAE